MPTLFVQETFGHADRVAHVGKIMRAELKGHEVVIEYIYDPDIPGVPNDALERFATELDIKDFQFSRTHWSVKQVDLYRILLKNTLFSRYRPTVFRLADYNRTEQRLVSVMMPFEANFRAVYTTLQKTAEAIGLKCQRADDIWKSPVVIADIVALIERSKVVICDCTGRNPNVFYEIGIAHTLGREVILITQNEADIPFDVRHLTARGESR